jgi:acyl carrier protein
VSVSAAEIQRWIIEQLAATLQVSPDQIQIDQPVLSYGIDSMQVVGIIANLEDKLGIRFSSNPLDDYPTIEALSHFLTNEDGDSSATG